MAPTFTQETELKPEERRSTPRWNIESECTCRISSGSKSYEGCIRDVSCLGAQIATDRSFSANQKIDLTIRMPGYDTVFVSGTIAWTQAVNDQNMIGVHFSNTSREAQDVILKYALRTNKEALMNFWFEGWEGK